MIVFMVLSVLGFIASATVHLASWGHEPLGMEQTWPLHVGIFVVLLPALMAAKRGGGQDPQFGHAPPWMVTVQKACGAYAIVNFLIFIVLISAFTPNVRKRDGKQVIVAKREVVRVATDEEVRLSRARTARGFSGHWMIFYWTALLMMIDTRARNAAADPAPAD